MTTMMTIEWMRAFKKDYRRIKSDPRHRNDIDGLLAEVTECLTTGKPIPRRYGDHILIHNWKGHRECRLKGNLLLIYRHLADGKTIEFCRLGSHSTLFRI